MTELRVYTIYDEKDLMCVDQIVEYDDDGEEVIHSEATAACADIATCADQGKDLWSYLREEIQHRLNRANIPYTSIVFDSYHAN